jgi:hypothetical protein
VAELPRFNNHTASKPRTKTACERNQEESNTETQKPQEIRFLLRSIRKSEDQRIQVDEEKQTEFRRKMQGRANSPTSSLSSPVAKGAAFYPPAGPTPYADWIRPPRPDGDSARSRLLLFTSYHRQGARGPRSRPATSRSFPYRT